MNASLDSIMEEAAVTWVQAINNITENLGTSDPFLYINHAGYFQKPFCGYGKDSLEFLREVAAKYDPGEVFQKLVPGGFKVSQEC